MRRMQGLEVRRKRGNEEVSIESVDLWKTDHIGAHMLRPLLLIHFRSGPCNSGLHCSQKYSTCQCGPRIHDSPSGASSSDHIPTQAPCCHTEHLSHATISGSPSACEQVDEEGDPRYILTIELAHTTRHFLTFLTFLFALIVVVIIDCLLL